MSGAIRNGICSHERHSSPHSKTHRSAMGFSFHSTGCVERPKECWNESHNINGAVHAAKGMYTVHTLKEKPAGVNRRARLCSLGLGRELVA
jgi:hypothetical protein